MIAAAVPSNRLSRRAWMSSRVLAGLVLAGLMPPAARADEPQRRPWPAGKPTPALALPAWEGGPWRLDGARGSVVVVNFWAGWCEPCQDEMPSLALLQQRHERDRLRVVAVNFRETDGAIRRFLEDNPVSLTLLRDTDGAAARAWQVRVFPTTFVVDRQGRVRFGVTGEVDWSSPTAREWIRSVL